MNCVTIKHHRGDGQVAVEMYDTDTNAVGGHTVSTSDLWRWLWEYRPCQVRVHGRVYSLQPAVHAAHSVLNADRGMEGWRANSS
jgi:hypothetical protein